MNSFKAIFLFVVSLPFLASAQSPAVDSSLSAIESLYSQGQYLSAELESRRMLEQPELSDSAKVQIEKWIAFSLIAQGKTAAARERFMALIKIDKSFELDQMLTSPKILPVFNDAKVKYLSQKRTSVNADTSNPAAMRQGEASAVSFRTIIFPGWEQFHRGRETTAILFSGAGGAALASGIVCEFLRAGARTEYLNAQNSAEIASKYKTYNTYRKTEIYSFSAFAVVYVISQIDVFAHPGLPVTVDVGFSPQEREHILFTVKF